MTNLATLRDHRADGYGLELEDLPNSRIAAIIVGATYFYTGRACKHGHLSARYTKGGRCTWCTRIGTARVAGQTFTARLPKALANETRRKAHKADQVTYVPAKPCKHGHGLRWVSSNNCVECDRLARLKYTEDRKTARIVKIYGLTEEQHEQLFLKQNRGCAVCMTTFVHRRAMHVDHCHDTGRIRGLLCQPCNQAIGLFRDSAQIMRAAAEYCS